MTQENRECTALRRAMALSDVENDKIVITRNICTVDEDWIEAIETGLVFIEKAIKEERQFIYSNGEVVPIEKVKHVSKDSVQHLAKHSNLITKEQEGEDIIPDQLYSVERLNDYAVYENRFLYMLLCYLRDFVTIRYDKILDLSNKYDGVLKLNKVITLPSQRITYSVDMHDERKDDKFLRESNPAKDVIDRIDLILKTVMSFLATPLMEIAGKAAKLKPPITKTNVLKMDNNFKGAVALYDFIIAYDKPGYTSESKKVELDPFEETLADELSEAGALLSFLTYEYGLGLNAKLKNSYNAEEERRKAEQLKRREEQLEVLKRRLAAMEISPDEYILELEKQVKLLQSDNRQLEPLRNRIVELKITEEKLIGEIKALKNESRELRDQIVAIEGKHIQEMEELKAEYNERIHDNIVKHEAEMRELEKLFNSRLDEMGAKMRDQAAAYNAQLEQAKQSLGESDQKYSELEMEFETMLEQKRLSEARVKALRSANGESYGENEFTDKESFDELEREFEAFVKFYDERWGKVKKSIRKKLLNYQSLKGQNGQK
ncbi:MAG: hypothetical protein IJF55_00810 [Clostridia bacterium]|nr:hypothetical protein [Clostridia bacterium]